MATGVRFGWLAALLLWGCGGPAPTPAAPPPAAAAPTTEPSAQAAAPAPAPAAPAAQPGTSPRFPAPFTTEPAAVEATVVFVADGDTVRLKLAGGEVMVRLLGVNTPEKRSKYREPEPWGAEVAELARARWLGKTVQLTADLTKTDKYDRVLGYVALEGTDLGAWLLERGYARVFQPAAHPRRAHYLKLQAAARAAGVGVWGGPPAEADGVIGNRHSKVVHAPDCDYLPSERNRVPLASRDEAERAGYRPHSCLSK